MLVMSLKLVMSVVCAQIVSGMSIVKSNVSALRRISLFSVVAVLLIFTIALVFFSPLWMIFYIFASRARVCYLVFYTYAHTMHKVQIYFFFQICKKKIEGVGHDGVAARRVMLW